MAGATQPPAMQPKATTTVCSEVLALEPDIQDQQGDSLDTQSREQQVIDEGSYDSYQLLSRLPLTRENLALLDKMTGNEEARKPRPATFGSSTFQKTTTLPSRARSLLTTSSNFAPQAMENGILDAFSSDPATNLGILRLQLSERGKNPSPTPSTYERFRQEVAVAKNEATIQHNTAPYLLKTFDPPAVYGRTINQIFTEFPTNVGFNNGLSAPQPDVVEGLRLPQYQPFRLSDNLRSAIPWGGDLYALALPHLAGEWKRRDGDMGQAETQSAYDGAALVYARNEALSFLGTSDPPGYAAVTTFTTDGKQLNIFSHHAAPSGDGTNVKYHQNLVTKTNLTVSYEEFKLGCRQLQNAQDHAKEQSLALRDQLVRYHHAQNNAASN